ncbi:MAG: thiamine pyrophosphate-binding protein [Pseudomonadota bacterium]
MLDTAQTADVSRTGGIKPRHGGQILVDQLALNDVERVFCIPGESFLAALDGLYEARIQTVVCRHEGGAAMMAEADGKLTGRPGIAFVTRGPGATNASSGVHVAFQDSTPMILFVGQVASDQRDREAFQEVDYRAMFAPLAKWVAEIDRTDRIPEYVSRAFHVAMSGRPGPVVLALPEDMLSGVAEVVDAPPARPVHNAPSTAEVDAIVAELEAAERPLVIVGGPGWSGQASADLAKFAEAFDVPVGTSFRSQDYLDNRHPNNAGDVGIGINPALADRVRDADLLFVIGARLGEMTTSGYTLIESPGPRQRLVHTYPDPSEIGHVYAPALGVACHSGALVAALAERMPSGLSRWTAQREAAHVAANAWRAPQETPGHVKMEEVIAHLSRALPETAVITNGAGNYAAFLHRYFTYKSGADVWRTQLAPTSGSMGYGLPASIAAKLRYPERTVICMAGDGCFQMVAAEFGTACQYGANIVVIISNNGMYGTIRMHQERTYPGRVSGTAMTNPDFAAWAKSYGGYGETVERTEDFAGALDRTLNAGVPAILDLKVSPYAISPKMRLTAL